MTDDIDRLVDQLMPRLLTEIRPVARKLVEAGIRLERDRVVALIQPPPSPPPRESRGTGRPPSAEYGAVSGAVRTALEEISSQYPNDGAGAGDIFDFLKAEERNINLGQVRAALKLLHTNGDAIRIGRGRYLYRKAAESPPADSENPDAGASGHFALAAE